MTQKKLLFALPVVLLLVFSPMGSRAQEGVKRTDLQTHDLSIPGREVVQQMVELQPGVVVGVRPPTVEEVMETAARGVRMPRKSTSFAPKPRMGLVMRDLHDA